MQSSYSEAETSSVDSTPCDSFQLPQFESSGDYHTPDLPTPLSTPDSIEASEKRHNPYITSSVSMRSVSSNVINESLSKRPSSLPVFRQNGFKKFYFCMIIHFYCIFIHFRSFCLWT